MVFIEQQGGKSDTVSTAAAWWRYCLSGLVGGARRAPFLKYSCSVFSRFHCYFWTNISKLKMLSRAAISDQLSGVCRVHNSAGAHERSFMRGPVSLGRIGPAPTGPKGRRAQCGEGSGSGLKKTSFGKIHKNVWRTRSKSSTDSSNVANRFHNIAKIHVFFSGFSLYLSSFKKIWEFLQVQGRLEVFWHAYNVCFEKS